jgi:hypothetical protein
MIPESLPMSETPDPWLDEKYPLTSEIFAAYYEKEGRGADDGERDLWEPVRSLERRLREAEETREAWKSQMDDWRADNHKVLAARDNAIERAVKAEAALRKRKQ